MEQHSLPLWNVTVFHHIAATCKDIFLHKLPHLLWHCIFKQLWSVLSTLASLRIGAWHSPSIATLPTMTRFLCQSESVSEKTIHYIKTICFPVSIRTMYASRKHRSVYVQWAKLKWTQECTSEFSDMFPSMAPELMNPLPTRQQLGSMPSTPEFFEGHFICKPSMFVFPELMWNSWLWDVKRWDHLDL